MLSAFLALALTVGAVLSMLIGPKVADAEFPALSVAVPLVVAVVALKVWSAVQLANPEPPVSAQV